MNGARKSLITIFILGIIHFGEAFGSSVISPAKSHSSYDADIVFIIKVKNTNRESVILMRNPRNGGQNSVPSSSLCSLCLVA